MRQVQPPRHFRLLLVEDDVGRVEELQSWLPSWARLVWTQSAGAPIGLIRRDRGRVYGDVLLDHDLGQRARTTDDESLPGTAVALALVESFSIDIPILIHSTNQVQIPRVFRQLGVRGFWVTRIPFYDLTEVSFLACLEDAHDLLEESSDEVIGDGP